MDELGGALRELARDAQAPVAADPADLWRRGRARVRRRRAAGVAIAGMVAAVVAGGSFAVTPPGAISPAGTDATHGPAVPKNVYRAKGWYPGTKDDPPGAVAVIGGLVRGDRMGLFSVSATTGAYRLLDLPDQAAGDVGFDVALSPDGTKVAYWLSGEPSGEPLPTRGEDLPVGVGVYDAVTGKVERYLPETEHGISTDELLWVDDEMLLMAYGQRTSPTASERIATYSWDPSGGSPSGRYDQPVRLAMSDLWISTAEMPRLPAGQLVRVGERKFVPMGWDGPVAEGPTYTLPKLGAEDFYEGATTSSKYLVAAVRREGGQGQMYVESLENPEGGALPNPGSTVEALNDTEFVGWLSDDRILVLGSAAEGHEYGTIYSYDLTTGTRTKLGTAEGGMYSPGLVFATGLLQASMVEGVKPPTVDPRWYVAGGAVGIVVLGALVVPIVLRRRRG